MMLTLISKAISLGFLGFFSVAPHPLTVPIFPYKLSDFLLYKQSGRMNWENSTGVSKTATAISASLDSVHGFQSWCETNLDTELLIDPFSSIFKLFFPNEKKHSFGNTGCDTPLS